MSESSLEIDDANEKDIHNFRESRRVLGQSLDLSDDLVKVYKRLGEAFTAAPSQADKYAVSMLSACRKHLTLSITSLLRLHLTQALRETRSAVEAAGIAYAIRANSEVFAIFREDGTPESRKKALKTLKSGVLFPASVPKMHALKKHFDLASTMSHTNLVTFARHYPDEPGAKPRTFRFQDLGEPAVPNLHRWLYWICVVHLEILGASDVIYNGILTSPAPFLEEHKYVRGKLARFYVKARSEFAALATWFPPDESLGDEPTA